MIARSPDTAINAMESECLVEPAPDPSRVEAAEGTDMDVEIIEEGEEGESLGPVSRAVKGQPDLTPATYRIGHSRVTEKELDEYVAQGLYCGFRNPTKNVRP